MNIFQLSWKNLFAKPLSTLLSLILLALGVGLVSLLLNLNKQLQDKFDKNLAGINMVLGAKGSPLQLILCNMYHIDNPTGNIAIKEAKAFLNPKHPLIKLAVPLSLGDSYDKYRIVGTDYNILELYKAEVQEGKRWEQLYEVTIGATVAKEKGLKIGDTFKSTHGFGIDENLVHEDANSFKIVGILKPTGAVIDQLILTNTQSVWAVHDHEGHDVHDHSHGDEGHNKHDDHDHHEDHKGHEHDDHDHHNHSHSHEVNQPLVAYEDKDITSILIQFKGHNARTLNMPRAINENTNMLAANPAHEINRLYSMMGIGADAMKVIALIIIIVSGLSVFISLYSSLKQRKYDLALQRVMGASPTTLFLQIILEGLFLAFLGYILGILLSHVGMQVFSGYLEETYRYDFTAWNFLQEEFYLLLGALGIGFLAAIIPAIQARNTDISKTLSEGS